MLPVKAALDFLAHSAALLGALSLFRHLEPVVQATFIGAFILGLSCDRRGRHPVPTSVADFFSLACFILYFLQLESDHFIEPAVNLLVLLLAVRLVLPKGEGHHLQMFILALFTLAVSALVAPGPLPLFLLGLQLPAVLLGLVLLAFHTADERLVLGRRELRRLLPVFLILPAASFPLLLALPLIPRPPLAFWHLLDLPPAPTLAETVRPGGSAGSSPNSSILFRAVAPELPAGDLYWRAIVLNTLEGETWVRRPPPAGEDERVRAGVAVRQTIYPEPGPGGYLPALDVAARLEGIAARGDPDRVHAIPAETNVRRYEALSFLQGTLETSGRIESHFYLPVPDVSARMREAAGEIAMGRDDREKIARLETFLRLRRLAYATSDLPGPENSIDVFLFEKGRGNCEFFASAAAMLLRLSGVPSRLVGGYLGGEYNTVGRYYTLREEHAHVWVEALVEGREWVRLDPTAFAATGLPPVKARRSRGAALADAADFLWSRVVPEYAREQQVKLRTLPARITIGPWWGWGAALIAAGGVWLRRQWRLRPEERLLRAFLRRVERRYRLPPLPPSAGLGELAARMDDPDGREFLRRYQEAVFGDRPLDTAEVRALRRLIRGVGSGGKLTQDGSRQG